MQNKPEISQAAFVLYHTEGCHLCDIAMALLNEAGVVYTLSDICENELLVQQYGTRIPVFKKAGSEDELNWPFDFSAISAFTGV